MTTPPNSLADRVLAAATGATWDATLNKQDDEDCMYGGEAGGCTHYSLGWSCRFNNGGSGGVGTTDRRHAEEAAIAANAAPILAAQLLEARKALEDTDLMLVCDLPSVERTRRIVRTALDRMKEMENK